MRMDQRLIRGFPHKSGTRMRIRLRRRGLPDRKAVRPCNMRWLCTTSKSPVVKLIALRGSVSNPFSALINVWRTELLVKSSALISRLRVAWLKRIRDRPLLVRVKMGFCTGLFGPRHQSNGCVAKVSTCWSLRMPMTSSTLANNVSPALFVFEGRQHSSIITCGGWRKCAQSVWRGKWSLVAEWAKTSVFSGSSSTR